MEAAYNAGQFGSVVSPGVQMLDKADGISPWVVGTVITIKALSNETGGTYSAFEDMVPPGEMAPPHFHTREEEFWLMLDCEQEWTVGDKTWTATPGSFMHLPRFVPHGFKGKSDKPGTKLAAYAPGGFESFFLDIGVPIAERYNPGPPPDVSPELLQKIVVHGKKYGVVFLSPDSKETRGCR